MNARSIKTIIGCVLVTAFSTCSYITLTNYLVPLSEILSVSVGAVSLIFTFSGLAGMVCALVLGKLVEAVKVRVLMAIASVAFILFHVCIYFADSITVIYAASILFGIVTVLGGFGICLTVISWWAGANAGKATSSLSIGVGLVSSVASPIVASSISIYGARTTALFQGFICGAVMLLATFTLVSEHPSNYRHDNQKESSTEVHGETDGLTMKAIFKTVPFWAILVAIALFNIACTGFTNNASAIYQTLGVDVVNASFGISAFNIAQLFWAFAYGAIVDKRGPGLATTICAITGAVALILTTLLSGTSGVIIIACLIASMSIASNIGAVTYPRVFGARETGTLVGLASAASSIGSMLGAPIAAFMYGATGSYNTYLYVAAAATVLCAILVVYGARKKYS